MKITSSPWGHVQSQNQIAPGIVSVSTAGHGGIWVSEERLKAMPADVLATKNYSGAPNWFEEDCDWAKVVLSFPEAFKPQDFYFAVQTCSYTDYLKPLLTPERQAKADAWLAENGDKWASGGGMTKDGGWIESAYKLTDRSQRKSKWFPGVVVLPAVFTLEEFENAKLYSEVRQAELFAA